jgi:hypothetical protein
MALSDPIMTRGMIDQLNQRLQHRRNAMLAGFALYQPHAAQPPTVTYVSTTTGTDRHTMATPPGTRLMRIIRLPRGWRVWTATRDFVFGTYLELFDDGRVLNCTVRDNEGDDYYWTRPSDDTIRSMQ